MAMNLYSLLHETATRQPQHPAVLGPRPDDRLSYRELLQRIDNTADALEQAGIRLGDTVGLHLPSGVDYIVYVYAIWRCGGCVVPIPVELRDAEKQEICREIALDSVISPHPATFLESTAADEVRSVSGNVAVIPIDSPVEHPAGFANVNSAFIRFTSGTTGDSKGVVLSHETVRERFEAANEVLHIGPDDRVIWMLSMSYHFTVSIVGYLTFGAGIILPSNHLADGILDAAIRHRGTFLYASPIHCEWLAESPRAAPLPDLRIAISTAMALRPEIAAKFHERYRIPITQALGLIEVGLPCINTGHAADQPDAVGHVLPAYELKLEETGLGPDLQEISFRGPGFLDAYYRPWRTRSEITTDGWFATGDIGSLDDSGCLHIRGRSKDVINVMGMKFFPQEVERVLLSHPGVQEAAVLTETDERLGEIPVAQIVPEAGAADDLQSELRELCQDQLTSFKIPHRFDFVTEVERTASGKVLHRPVPRASSFATAAGRPTEH